MAPVLGGTIALLDTLTGPEVLTILVVALIVLGPDKLPGVARQAGVWVQKIRQMSQSLQSELREVLDDPAMEPLRELGEFATQPRRKLADYARQLGTDTPSSTPGGTGAPSLPAAGDATPGAPGADPAPPPADPPAAPTS